MLNLKIGNYSMPDITKFKSVSVSIKTDNTLEELSKTLFPVMVSKQKVIEYLINEHLKKEGG